VQIVGAFLALAFGLCLFFGFRTGEMLVKAPLPNASWQSSPVYFWTVALLYILFVIFGISLVFEA